MTASSRPPLVGADGEVREITVDDLAHARRGRPKLPPEERKQRVTMLLDPDVLSHFKATGKGWQTRINEVLRASFKI